MLLYLFLAYVLAGTAFATIFLRGANIGQFDEDAQGISPLTKAFLFSGCAALWPILLQKWLQNPAPEFSETAKQRNPDYQGKHRKAWLSLALLLPLGWLAAVLAVPGKIFQQPARAPQPEPLAQLLGSSEIGDFLVNLRADSSGGRRQVEVFIKKPLSSPNALLFYKTENAPEILLGSLGSRGFYRFDLDFEKEKTAFGLRFFDNIKKRELGFGRF